MLTYEQLLTNRRSIRNFKDEKISKEIIQDILKDTCKAPSASNAQPWNFIVIQDKNLIQKISIESKKNLVHQIESNPETPFKRYKKMLSDPNFNVFYNAPCLVLIVGKNNYPYFQTDCALAAAYFMLAATERGLGTCWIGLGDEIHDPKLKAEIGLPEDHELVAPIILGYPEMIPPIGNRNTPQILKIIGI